MAWVWTPSLQNKKYVDYFTAVIRLFYLNRNISFQFSNTQAEEGQGGQDGGDLLEGQGEIHHEFLPVFIQDVAGDV